MEHIFRAYDIRGIFPHEIPPETILKIGYSFGTKMEGAGRVAIARDGRCSSHVLESAFVSGLASTGCDVDAIGMLPIPVANYWTWSHGYKAGVYITASHNPPEFNGIRFRNSDGTGYTYENKTIARIYESERFIKAKWNEIGQVNYISTEDVIQQYINFHSEKINIKNKLTVALDPGNGASGVVIDRLFSKLGAVVHMVNPEVNGKFPARGPNPTNENLQALQKTVVTNKCNFGAAYDGDGDRVVFVDDCGRVVQTEKIGIIVAKKILENKGGGNVVANIPCSMIVEREIEKYGGKVIRVRVGDVFVCEEMKKHGAVFGMEISSHFFIPEYYWFDDPLLMSLKIAEILSDEDRPLSHIVNDIPAYSIVEKGYPCNDKFKFDVMKDIAEEAKVSGHNICLIDGVKVEYGNAWIMLRLSNTQPLIRLFAEAEDDSLLRNLVEEYEKKLKERIRKYEQK